MINGLLKTILLAAIAVSLMVTTACRTSEESPPKTIHYRLKWLFNVSVVGDLWAHTHGHFVREGLNVLVKPGGPERDVIRELELEHAQFGVASADQVIRARAKGSPIVVIAQLFQENPLQWIYRPDKTEISSVNDLRGKVIGITYGGNDETIMRALLAKYGIREDEVNFFSVRYDYTPFYEKKVDLWPVYRNAQGVIIGDKLRRGGETVQFFSPHDAGVPFVANSVVTTEKLYSRYPGTVQKFLRALISAWQEALDPKNSQLAVETIHRFDRETSLETITKQLEITRLLIAPAGSGIEIGRIDFSAWAETENIMLSQNLIERAVDIRRSLKPHSPEQMP
jgi:NitT/TauT family transport system substrate-binding protein